ncbi:nucleoside phosphorylase [bacterium]|nr:nucleoside phosphorylase [bacterium]
MNPDCHPLFTPAHFIRHYAPHLRRLNMPEKCLLHMMPNAGRLNGMKNTKRSRFLFGSDAHYRSGEPDHILVYAGTGAPAAGMTLEICIELGAREIIMIGTCGILNGSGRTGDLFVPSAFIRDEGTSAHYLGAESDIQVNASLNSCMADTLRSDGLTVHTGPHWTTDAPFMETSGLIESVRKKGCISVDMEASALFAIARHHRIPVTALMIGSDRITENGWSPPDTLKTVQNRFARLLSMAHSLFGIFDTLHGDKSL